eukprot:comp21234_c0_seq1/m.28917 comp21234_c0_seq1/g.28917  ORF comp21234_c0_seq1/g.28917 comp21234_c0_seq1/m.28917 type:complete len:254 (-) comp21234_c0_seq1:296-1057(-)
MKKMDSTQLFPPRFHIVLEPHPPSGAPPANSHGNPVNGSATPPSASDQEREVFLVLMSLAYKGLVFDIPVQVDRDTLDEAIRRKMAPPPAAEEAIGRLDTHVLGLDGNQEIDVTILGTVCVVCQCNMDEGEEVIVMPCSHAFHSECVVPWLKRHNVCPVCRDGIRCDRSVGGKEGWGAIRGLGDEPETPVELTDEDVSRLTERMSVNHVKSMISASGGKYDDCIERSDLVMRLLELLSKRRATNEELRRRIGR